MKRARATAPAILLALLASGAPSHAQEPVGALAGPDGRLRVGLLARGEGGLTPDREWTGRVGRAEVNGESCTVIRIADGDAGRPAAPLRLSRVRSLLVRPADTLPWIRIDLDSFVAGEPTGCAESRVGAQPAHPFGTGRPKHH